MNIYPSVLETTPELFEQRIVDLSSVFDYLQIDIVEESYVPNATISLYDALLTFEHHVPIAVKTSIELHCMFVDLMGHMPHIHNLNSIVPIKRLLLHADTIPVMDFEAIKYEIGLVLNPEHEVEKYIDMISQVSAVQIMTIHPGKQGQAFMPETIQKIDQLRELGFEGEIILDGGIDDKTLPYILETSKNPPTSVCPGSYFHEDIPERLKILQDIVLAK